VFSPSLTLSHQEKRFDVWATYHPHYRLQSEISSRNQFSHQAALRAKYTFSRRTTLSLSDNLFVTENDALTRFDAGDGDAENIEIDRQTALTFNNTANLQLTHLFTPRFSGTVSGFHRLRSYERRDVSDVDVLGASTSLSYAFTPRSRFGLGGSYTFTSFSDADPTDMAVSGSRSRTIQGLLSWVYDLDPRTRFQLSGGPAFVTRRRSVNKARRFPGARQFILNPANPSEVIANPNPPEPLFLNLSSCRPDGAVYRSPCDQGMPLERALLVEDAAIPPGLGFDTAAELSAERFVPPSQEIGNDEQLTFFGQVALTRTWDRFRVSLSYRRTESPNSGLGTTTQLDSVNLNTRWEVRKDWRTNLRLGYSHQSSFGDAVTGFSYVLVDSGVRGGVDTNGDGVIDLPDYTVAQIVDQEFSTTKQSADVNQFSADISLSRRLTERLRATAVLRAVVQRSASQVARRTGRDFEDYRINLGFEYVFDPVHF
jgi:hypothetical protein